MEANKREFLIENGQNIIQVMQYDFHCCLIIDMVLFVNWPVSNGGDGLYYSVYSKEIGEKRNKLTSILNKSLLNDLNDDIFREMNTFLKLFSNGRYEVFIGENQLTRTNLHWEIDFEYPTSTPIIERHKCLVPDYPFENEHIFSTKRNSTLDSEHVDYYKSMIKDGQRPKILTYRAEGEDGTNSPTLLLDGHHKTKAYLELGIDIPYVHITKWNTKNSDQRIEMLSHSKPIMSKQESNEFKWSLGVVEL